MFFVVDSKLIGPRYSYKGTPQGSTLTLCYLTYILEIFRTISIKTLAYYNTLTTLLSTEKYF